MKDFLKKHRNLSKEERRKIAKEMIEGYKKLIKKEKKQGKVDSSKIPD